LSKCISHDLKADISQKIPGILAGIDEFSASARKNQYEKGKHIPDFTTIKRFAKVLEVPACYFYAEDDEMAEMILVFGSLSPGLRAKTILKLKN